MPNISDWADEFLSYCDGKDLTIHETRQPLKDMLIKKIKQANPKPKCTWCGMIVEQTNIHPYCKEVKSNIRRNNALDT